MEEMLASIMNEEEVEVYRQQHPSVKLRSPEECYYHQIFMDVFEDAQGILSNVARWAERPL
jgi:asparagine synthase (glutamine-hydrolysing)